MSLMTLELSDAGILAAGGQPPKLLGVDGLETESPGFAIQNKKELLVGQSAERQARLHPQKVQHRFWGQLSTDPLKKPGRSAETHAEIAFAHLAQVWENIKPHGNEVMIAIPSFFNRHQLGLLLGMTQELSIPVKGLMPQAVAAVPHPYPGSHLLFLDVHLHHTEVTVLAQGDQLRLEETLTLDELGLIHLFRIWAETIAEEFVRTTRFDPLHEAASEQVLYDRLPDILNHLQKDPTTAIELKIDQSVHRITLNRDLLANRSESYLKQVSPIINSMWHKTGNQKDDATVLMTHRFSLLPGVTTILDGFEQSRLVKLKIGASALNMFQIWDQLDYPIASMGAAFFTSRPWQTTIETDSRQGKIVKPTVRQPTHILCENLAYPITEIPLFIGPGGSDAHGELVVGDQSSKDPHHCSVRRIGEEVVLTDSGNRDIFIDDQALESDCIVLHLGQTVRIETIDAVIRTIVCLKADES